MADENDGKRLVLQGLRGSEVVYLDGPPSVWGSWRKEPHGLTWELDQVESAERYLAQVRAQLNATLGASVTNLILTVWEETTRAPSPPPEASRASVASTLSPSPHNEVSNRERTGGQGSPTSPPEPPGARQGEEGEEGDGGDLARREHPVTVPPREGKHVPTATVKPNLFIREAPPPLAPRNWGTRDAPPFSRTR